MLTLKFKTTEIHKNHSEEAKEEISPLKNQPFVYFILGTLLYTFVSSNYSPTFLCFIKWV